MKYLFGIFVLFLNGLVFAQSGIVWQPEIIVADGSVYGNSRPRATVVDGDVPIVIFGKSGNQNLFIARWNGTSFNTPTSILPSNTSTYINNWTGPDIDSKGDTVIAVFKMEPLETGNVYSVRSTDGGITFSDTIRVDNHDVGVAWMPSLGMDNNGNPIASYMVHDANWTNPRYVVAHSIDAGQSYNPEMEITNGIPGEACDCCPSELIVKDNRQALLFRNNESNVRDVYGVLSTDGGITFPNNANIDNLNWNLQSCPSTGMDGIFGGDNLYMVYASAAEGAYRVYISNSSTVSGLSYTARSKIVEPDFGTQNYPRISGANDTIVLTWQETVNGNLEIFCSVSTPSYDPMVSLANYKFISNQSTTGSQYTPEVIYKNGFVHLFYADVVSGNLLYRRGTIDINAGIEENLLNTIIYPNPSTDGVFQINGDAEIVNVVNVAGIEVDFNVSMDGSTKQLILSSELKGVYFIRFEYEGQWYSKKIVVS